MGWGGRQHPNCDTETPELMLEVTGYKIKTCFRRIRVRKNCHPKLPNGQGRPPAFTPEASPSPCFLLYCLEHIVISMRFVL